MGTHFWYPVETLDNPGGQELTLASGRRISFNVREPISEGKGLPGSLDHILVIFDNEATRRYQVGRYDKLRFDESFLRDEAGNWRVPKWAR